MKRVKDMYLELKEKHQKESNEFPFMFAFSDNQFKEGMKKLGLEVTDTDKIYSIGMGAYIKKTDAKALEEMHKKHNLEMKMAISSSIAGEGFIFEMFNYELSNHEYTYTYDITDTLRALGITEEEVNNDERLLKGLNKAIKYQRDKAK